MKILVLCPLDEQHVYAATGIYKYLKKDAQDHCFSMPMYMQYAITTKQTDNWLYSVFDAMVAAQQIYKITDEKKDDLIIIGNMPNTYDFDVVFNFQEIEEALPYKDNFVEKIAEIVAEEPTLTKYVTNLHTSDESILMLKDCMASAEFLSAYLQTDPHLDDIITSYKDKFTILEKKGYAINASNQVK